VRRTVPPSAEIEEQIDRLLAVGVGENPRESLSELARLGARLIIQRAVEEEFDAWLGRASSRIVTSPMLTSTSPFCSG
jgi:putative transposase